ncbi:hypothetical protein EPO33_04815 [Patescibacteria group bacterium]|nr:MAG: hypothetical protein EPO33_04815 [Patescibacteria group bacterium]
MAVYETAAFTLGDFIAAGFDETKAQQLFAQRVLELAEKYEMDLEDPDERWLIEEMALNE